MRIYSWCRMSCYYAVAIGRKTGVFNSWRKCEEQVKGFKGAKYKKFPTRSAAEEFINYQSDKYKKPFNKHNLLKKCLNIENCAKEFASCNKESSSSETYLSDEDLIQALTAFENGNEPKETSEDKGFTNQNSESFRQEYIGEYLFQIDNEGFVIVYTDGSCFNNGQRNACAGYGVWFGENHPLNLGRPVTGRVTNNTGEIQAAAAAIRIATELNLAKLCIYTDSQFLIKSVTTWMKAWKTRNWTLANGQHVKNVTDFKELDSLLAATNTEVKWNYVPAHKGIIGNEMADRLAKKGSELYQLNSVKEQ